MADIKDVTAVIASALNEISVSGTLDVKMDGAEVIEALDRSGGDHVEVVVSVREASQSAPTPVADPA